MLRSSLGKLILAVALGVVLAAPIHAGTISLGWDAVQGATGYRIYYGTSSAQYPSNLNVGNVTEATVTGLTDCTSWFLAVKAYNSFGESPDFSGEISGWPRPVLNTASPPAALQGAQFTLDVRGTNFRAGSTVEIDNPYVFLGPPAVPSCSQIQVAATIEPTARGARPAEIGQYSLSVVHPDDVFGTRVGLFEVQINPERFDVYRDPGPSEGRIDARDIHRLSRLFGSREGDPTYDRDADLDGDGWLDGNDLAHLASNLGRCWNGTTWIAAACPASQ
jgi:hypothetical protein